MKREADLQKYVLHEAKELGIFARKLVAPGRRGFPDLMLAYREQVLFIELKSPSGRGRPSPQQTTEIQRMKDAGIWVEIVSSPAGADSIIQTLLNLDWRLTP